jgi:hypothetical protein
VDELEHNWDDDIYMGCCVLREDDLAEKPIAVAIASAREYREDVRRPTELNWRKTEAYRDNIETSFPEDRIGDGDVIVNDQSLSALLWGNIEAKIGRRDDLPGTCQRCRLVGFDTQEVRSKILLIVYEIC